MEITYYFPGKYIKLLKIKINKKLIKIWHSHTQNKNNKKNQMILYILFILQFI
jgi:hypothetical protein